MYRSMLRLLIPALLLLVSLPASAQFTRDNAANKKIDEAINKHYLATDFDRAESVLTGTVNACEDKCSPQTLAKAWMYVGIVRGSGRNDLAAAKEAFQTAHALDANVKLDAALATPETQAAFAEAGGGGAAPATPAEPAGEPAAAEPAAPAADGLDCTPDVTEVETRRAIPVQCTSDAEVTNLELRFKPFGSETWKSLRMERKGKSFRAQVPCDVTQTTGVFRLYVRGKDATGDEIANYGTKTAPIEIQLVEKSEQEPPSFDDADPPERCAAKEICPPDFPGCDSGQSGGGTLDWGASCGNSSECKTGLLCLDGTCETAPSCSTDTDCPVGSCEAGKCAVSGGAGAATGAGKKWWVGLHLAQDLALVSGSQVCDTATQNEQNFACYLPGNAEVPYDSGEFILEQGNAGNIGSGFVTATTRFLLSVDHAFTANLMGGVRLGYAINGGPPAGKVVEYNETNPNVADEVLVEGTKFLPYHAEGRLSYWFGSLPLGRKGFRFYAHVGGGLAQVDARVGVKIRDRNRVEGGPYEEAQLEAWKKLGQGFITAGGGTVFALSPQFGLQLNLNLIYMLPASGLVIQPSLGAVYGL